VHLPRELGDGRRVAAGRQFTGVPHLGFEDFEAGRTRATGRLLERKLGGDCGGPNTYLHMRGL